MSLYTGEAWAVRISVNHVMRAAWLNHGGGYSAERYDRKLWKDYDDALDASHQWDAHDPVIVRVKFRAAPFTSDGGPK